MIHRVDDRLREEARRFRLVFACPDCAAFDPGVRGSGSPDSALRPASPRCSLGFPVEPHADPSLDGRDEVIFCKAFELR